MRVSETEVLERIDAPKDTDRIRELFLTIPHTDLSGLRPIIARSWYRCKAAGVDAVQDRRVFQEGRVDEHTSQVAEPFLRELDGLVEDAGGYVNLTAPNGALLRPGFLRGNDRYPAGYSLLEENVGSNSEGLALEEGRGVWLAPGEHFREDMRGNWCFASLVRDPFHNRVRAVIGLTFYGHAVGTINPAPTLLMLEGVRSRIERELERQASTKQRALLREYITLSRRLGNSPVIAFDGKNTMMNAAATAALEDTDLSVISGYAKTVMATGRPLCGTVSLNGLGDAQFEMLPVQLSGTSWGTTIVLHARRASLSGARTDTSDSSSVQSGQNTARAVLRSRFDGASSELQRMLTLAEKAVTQNRSVTIVGEPGTGKRRLADTITAVHATRMAYDARGRLHGTALPDLLSSIDPETPTALLIEHAEEMSQLDARETARHLRRVPKTLLVVTASRLTEAAVQLTEACDALEISMTPLRSRREDIPAVARAIAREIGDRGLSRRLLATLTDADWPRNVDQLRLVVSNAVEHATGDEATVEDLPQSFHRALSGNRLSRLEEAEYSELRAALHEAHGNRRLAAESLEIGRSTLYRRMDYFRSRGFEF
ncbi:MAG: helix-turn-helix domain-containing protein [Microbacterium sp.]